MDLHRVREFYWSASDKWALILFTINKSNRIFGKSVVDSYLKKYVIGVRPALAALPDNCAEQAVRWLTKAQDAREDKGVSYGYFPCGEKMGWRPSYPETTGYIIASLIDYAKAQKDDDILNRAVAMAEWETKIQMASGAVQGGMATSSDKQKAAVFNTGMVLQGWTAVYRQTNDAGIFEAGRKAADFLVTDMDARGHYRTHGGFVSANQIKTYNVLCSWALYRFGEDSNEEIYKKAALKNAEATLGMQLANGWFESCCLTHSEKPLTHTLGYTLQGLLEIGILAQREDFISAVEKGVEPLIRNIKPNGYLAGRFDRSWKSKAAYSCLTGSAQIAIVLYRIAQIFGKSDYIDAADRLVDFLKALQVRGCPDLNMNGAIAGSFPLLGGYMTAGYPNWATKYFLDALLLQKNHWEKQKRG
ncbi:hypothetical protein [Desulfobacter sp. UBA2225]|uniref:hypothetical protein n=1 Tax=Desulfobacter sp. UBA2225 TaxID=1961413 RepID=UPI00257BE1DC|nr:hypothetical protein [Desulfobacter sp. UBA2225]